MTDDTGNPYSPPVACASCNDLRNVYRADYSAKPCPVCGCSCAVPAKGDARSEQCLGCVKRRDLMRAAWSRNRTPPSIDERDLTVEERRVVAEWKARHPRTAPLTFLSWIEGRRYNPEKDTEFLKELFSLGITVETKEGPRA